MSSDKLTSSPVNIREMLPQESEPLGQLMLEVYSKLDGMPSPKEQPAYYDMLANIGDFSNKKGAKVLVAVSEDNDLLGGVVYFGDMSEYGSGGTATRERNASGIRLLGVAEKARGLGIGKLLTNACIQLAEGRRHPQIILHTTQAMVAAWKMYEHMGFERSEELDFLQQGFPVFGFRLRLED